LKWCLPVLLLVCWLLHCAGTLLLLLLLLRLKLLLTGGLMLVLATQWLLWCSWAHRGTTAVNCKVRCLLLLCAVARARLCVCRPKQ
jgi:hypothetical protein